MKSVNASHILVKTEEECLSILKEVADNKISFENAAKKYSLCPSKKDGGSLGSFGKGMMVVEFEDACFSEKNNAGDILGPIKTKFGFHLIKVNKIE